MLLHPGRLTWNIIKEVGKIMFLSKWVICMFHVNLPGCKGNNTDQINVESLGPASNLFIWMCHVGILHHHKLNCEKLSTATRWAPTSYEWSYNPCQWSSIYIGSWNYLTPHLVTIPRHPKSSKKPNEELFGSLLRRCLGVQTTPTPQAFGCLGNCRELHCNNDICGCHLEE